MRVFNGHGQGAGACSDKEAWGGKLKSEMLPKARAARRTQTSNSEHPIIP